MPKITITIEEDIRGLSPRREEHSIRTGYSVWSDHKFFLMAANQAAIGLSEKLHLEDDPGNPLGEVTP